MKNITRIGAYGVCKENERILLVPKRSGLYKGQLDLPGGRIEFGETPEETLRREFIEEAACGFKEVKLLCNLVCLTELPDSQFHHIGLIYSIYGSFTLPQEPEDEFYWIEFSQLSSTALTPFARQALNYV